MCSQAEDVTLTTTPEEGPPADPVRRPSSRQRDLETATTEAVQRAYRAGVDALVFSQQSMDSLVTSALSIVTPIAEKPDPYHEDPARATFGRDDYDSWVQENSNLRRHLLWLAGRPGITLDDRRELAARIKNTLSDGGVVMDSDEDASRDFREIRGTLEKLEPLLSTLVETLDQRVSESVQQGVEAPRRLPSGFTNRVDQLLSRIREHIQEFPELDTLERLRSVR